jgi:hypothetical protein
MSWRIENGLLIIGCLSPLGLQDAYHNFLCRLGSERNHIWKMILPSAYACGEPKNLQPSQHVASSCVDFQMLMWPVTYVEIHPNKKRINWNPQRTSYMSARTKRATSSTFCLFLPSLIQNLTYSCCMSVSVWRVCFTCRKKLELLYMSVVVESEIYSDDFGRESERDKCSDVLKYVYEYLYGWVIYPMERVRMAWCRPEFRDIHVRFQKLLGDIACVCVAVWPYL